MPSMTHYATGDRGTTGDIRQHHLTIAREELESFRIHVDRDYARSLSALIEGEIIPRLMAAHAVDAERLAVSDSEWSFDDADIEALAPLVMRVDADALLAHVEDILDRGVTVETVMVDLLAPTARLLGEYWEDDRCDFVDVTMGLWRLQEVVHEIASRAPADRVGTQHRYRALFASMPGDQHSFGTVVIDEVFRRAGWSTDRICEAHRSDLLDRAGHGWFDMIGLTISCDCHIADLASNIAALRKISSNSRVCIMVGGRIFSANPGLAAQVGADGTASDAKLALEVAAKLVRQREREAAACS
ncbi:cobalamin B12-binding domain-containing protein [Sphingomonas ginsenosidivorax]|nr:cobalamin B12-binding domain-containing protein [Sphingomonas ginsenosidivorax]